MFSLETHCVVVSVLEEEDEKIKKKLDFANKNLANEETRRVKAPVADKSTDTNIAIVRAGCRSVPVPIFSAIEPP